MESQKPKPKPKHTHTHTQSHEKDKHIRRNKNKFNKQNTGKAQQKSKNKQTNKQTKNKTNNTNNKTQMPSSTAQPISTNKQNGGHHASALQATLGPDAFEILHVGPSNVAVRLLSAVVVTTNLNVHIIIVIIVGSFLRD